MNIPFLYILKVERDRMRIRSREILGMNERLINAFEIRFLCTFSELSFILFEFILVLLELV